MEALAVLLVLAAVLLGPVLAIIALIRTSRVSRLEARVHEQERQLSRLVARIYQLEQQGSRDTPAVEDTESSATPDLDLTEELNEPAPAPTPTPTPPPTSMPPPEAPAEPAHPTSPAPPKEFVPHTSKPKIDWERWIGIRGAALLGAIALALAGLLFFKYSIEQGLITPVMRVVMGTLTGLACLTGSEVLRRRGYRHTADGIAGAGAVILYAAFWAANILYGLIGMFVAFGLMALVTAACCVIAVRRNAMVVAVLGLVGGFATPLLLSTGSDRPIGLFGYVLLLDLGLLFVGHRRRWPSLAALSLIGTALMQALWIGERMTPDRLWFGLIILALFSLMFAFMPRGAGDVTRVGFWTRLGAILYPFAFALYFAGRVDLGPRLYPIGLLLALLSVGAGWLSLRERRSAIGTGAAVAGMAVVGIWVVQHPLTNASAWETIAVTVGLALIFHLFVEYDPTESSFDSSPAPAACIAIAGSFLITIPASNNAAVTIWPFLVGWLALAALCYRHASFPGRSALQLLAAAGLGAGFTALHAYGASLPATGLFLGLLLALPAASTVLAIGRQRAAPGTSLWIDAERATAVLSLILLVGLSLSDYLHTLEALPALCMALLLAIPALLTATRLGQGGWFAGAAAASWFVHIRWIFNPAPVESVSVALLVLAAGVLLFTCWPLLPSRRLDDDASAWYTAALTGPLWFFPLRFLFELRFGDGFIGLLPVALGAVSLGALLRSRALLPSGSAARRRAEVWFSAVALCMVALAIPLQLDREWITIGWALQGFAVLALWKRLNHPGLKYFGLGLLGVVGARLLVNPALLHYHPRSTVRLVNWLLYTYLVPAAAMIGGMALLRPLELERARSWETTLYRRGHALGANACGVGAILVVFAWINLAVADWFATGPFLTLSFGDRPDQRLAVSIAWALYALILLGLGMARGSLGLRWLSLGFLLFTIGKVFLYDLGALRDLYRVASLVGLAISLILVSLLYQRFVFRRDEPPPPGG